jgi:hypothetical protein
MPIVISRDLVLTDVTTQPEQPIVGWHNLVTAANIDSTTEDVDFPVSNLANPATHLKWVGAVSTIDEYLTVTTNYVDEIDYLAVAKHNFGTATVTLSVEGKLDDGNSPAEPYLELVEEHILADDSPVLFRFDPQILTHVRLRIQQADAVPEAAVVYVGKLLVLPRNIWQGHTPLKYARKTRIVNGRSESGNFLGRIMLGETRESEAQLSLIDPDTYRSDLEPFIAAAQTQPFFFAWRPATYPREVGYAWMMGDPRPLNAPQHGLTEITLPMQGIA